MTTSVVAAKLVVMPGMVSTTEAAARLHLTTRQVQRLARTGQLVQVARGLLDATSIEQHLAVAQRRRAPWSTQTAWGAVALLSGQDAPWMGGTQRSRLRARLRTMSAADLVERTRARATVTRYSGHPSTVDHLRPRVIEPSSDGLGLTAPARDRLDGYVPAAMAELYVTEHGLTSDSAGRITLRATPMNAAVVTTLAGRGVLAALDLASSLDPREHRAGTDALERALAGLRG